MSNLVNGLGGTAGFGESTLGQVDDTSATINLSSTFGGSGLSFLGIAYSQLSINENGNITFGGTAYAQKTPVPLHLTGRPIIAAYFSDVLAGAGQAASAGGTSTGSNRLWYDEDAVNHTLTVTWDDIGGAGAGPSLQNAFQLQLIGVGGSDFDLLYRYEAVNWSNVGGPRAGFSAGDGVGATNEFPGSGGVGGSAVDLDVVPGNTGVAGFYRFSFRSGTAGNDVLTGSSFASVLSSLGGNDSLLGGTAEDTMDGGAGEDTLQGGLGNDTMLGGPDLDTVSYTSAFGAVVVSLGSYNVVVNQFIGSANGAAGADYLIDFENIIGSDFNDALTGNALANQIYGLGGNDTLTGLGGDDTLHGGLGNHSLDGGADTDTAAYADASGAVVVSLESQIASGAAGVDMLIGIENIVGSAFADTLTGDATANKIFGLAGDDTLTGLEGSDTLDGGDGNDTASYSYATSAVQIDLGTGAPTSGGDGPDTLISIENLWGSDYGDSLTGSAADNAISGGFGRDTIDGGAGADRLYGNGLVDYYDPDDSNLLTGGDGNDTLFGAYGNDTLFGGAGNDSLNEFETDSSGNDSVMGGDGHDSLYSGGGNDTLQGDGGNDSYFLSDLAGSVFIFDSAGIDTVVSNVNYNLGAGLENLIFEGNMSGGDGNELDNSLFGNNLSNTMGGREGNDLIRGHNGGDTIDGGLGADTMYGGSDDDVYIVDSVLDVVIEENSDGDDQPGGVDSGGGTDRVEASVNYTLGQYLNNLTLTGANAGQIGFGNALRNILIANIPGSYMSGEAGDDTLYGGIGNDTLLGGAGADALSGYSGADLFDVSAANQPSPLSFSTVDKPDLITDFGSSDFIKLGAINGLVGPSPMIWRGDAPSGFDFYGVLGEPVPGQDFGADVLQMWRYYIPELQVISLFIDSNRNFVVDGSDFLLNVSANDPNAIGPAAIVASTFASSHAGIGNGSAGNDTMVGNTANNSLFALGGNDSVFSGAGDDSIDGGDGNDSLAGGIGFDTIYGGIGNDTLNGGNNADRLYGGDGNDSLYGGKSADLLEGGDGDDVLFGQVGDDSLYGGNGTDTIDYAAGDAVTVNLALLVGGSTVSSVGLFNGNDILQSIENVVGSRFADSISGDLGVNVLTGGDGNDMLAGGAGGDSILGGIGNDNIGGGKGGDKMFGEDGNDTLNGNLGNDQIGGGLGVDKFIFNSVLNAATNVDTILDFQSGVDQIHLSASIFGALSGQIGQTTAPDTHLLYNGATGTLSYDADGTGSAPATLFAIVGTISHPGAMGSAFLVIA